MQGGGAEQRKSAKWRRTKLGLIFRVGLILQHSWKIAPGLIIGVGLLLGETQYMFYLFLGWNT